jgi:hypothetical protein
MAKEEETGGDDSSEPGADASNDVSGPPPFLAGGGIAFNRKKASKEESVKGVHYTVESDTTNAVNALSARCHIEVAEGKPEKDDNDRTEHAFDESAAAASISAKIGVTDASCDVGGGLAAAADESEAARNRKMASKKRAETEANGVSSLFSHYEPGGMAAALRLVEESMNIQSIESAHPPSLRGEVTKGVSRSTISSNEVTEAEREVGLEEIGSEQTCDVVSEADGSEVGTEADDWFSLDMLLVDGLVGGNTLPVGSELDESVDVSAESVDVVRGKEEERKERKRAKKEAKKKKKERKSVDHQSPGKGFCDAIPETLSFCTETEPSTASSILPKTPSGDVHLEDNKKTTATDIQDCPRVDSGAGDIFHAALGDLAESALDQKFNGLMSVTPNYSTDDKGQGSTDVPSRDVNVKDCNGSSDVSPSPSGNKILQQNDLPRTPSSRPPASPSKEKGLRWMRRFNENDDNSVASGASYDSAARDGSQASDGSHKGSPLHRFLKKRPKGKR